MSNRAMSQLILDLRTIIGDATVPYKYADTFILSLLNQEYGIEVDKGKMLGYKDSILGDNTGRYSLDANLTYNPIEIKRVFIDATEIGRIRHLEADVIEGTPTTTISGSGSQSVYLWRKVRLNDSIVEQTLTTGSGELTLANLKSRQGSLPTFIPEVAVDISSGYQDRTAMLSTQPTIVGGNVEFKVKVSKAGISGDPYFDIIVRQL